nr:FAD/NAD(P)-binding domain-containing protein [Kineosporia babensis]
MIATRHVVIVGAGPRAISVLDRLAIRFARVRVTLIDPYGPGGRIWRRDQPAELLMNTFAGDSTIFADPSHTELGGFGPDLWSWAQAAQNAPGLTEAELQAMKTLQKQDYAPRFLFGTYCHYSFQDLLNRLPEGLQADHLADTVTQITDRPDGTQQVLTANGRSLVADAVVLATGHTDTALSARDQHLHAHAQAQDVVYGPPALPTETPVDEVPAGADVVLRGMALNFFDLVAMLTEGRGGHFERVDGQVRYVPSGQEPVIHAGSRRGIPSYSRIDTSGPTSGVSFLDQAVIERLLAQAPDIDLRRDVWPAVLREASWIYYWRLHPDAVNEEDFRKLTPQTPEWDAMIARIEPRQADRLDLDAMEAPLLGKIFGDQRELDHWMIGHLGRDLASSANPDGPRAGVGEFLRVARGKVYPLMAAGGVSGTSYSRDARWFHALLRNIGNGPPRVRTEQLAALARAGVVRFLGADVEIGTAEEGFVVTSSSLPGYRLHTRYVLDAFVPSPDLRVAADPLWQQLRATGGARTYQRPDPNQTFVQTGAVDVEEPTSRMVLDSGPHPARFVLGAATEGARWNTAMASKAGVRSRFVIEADEIARCVLNQDRA